jgi:hypothetical protein
LRIARDFRRSQLINKLLAHRALDPLPSSSLAEEKNTSARSPPPCGGARFSDARSFAEKCTQDGANRGTLVE